MCLKIGHTASVCWYRFDEDYIPEQCVAAMASSSTGANPNWYMDSGATDHIISELEKLIMHELYVENVQIRAANGAGMEIIHICNSVLASLH
jgi:hypothetical protein